MLENIYIYACLIYITLVRSIERVLYKRRIIIFGSSLFQLLLVWFLVGASLCLYTISITFTIDKNLHKTHRCLLFRSVCFSSSCCSYCCCCCGGGVAVVVVVVCSLWLKSRDCRLSGQKQRDSAAVKVKVEVGTHTNTHTHIAYINLCIYKASSRLQSYRQTLLLLLLRRP